MISLNELGSSPSSTNSMLTGRSIFKISTLIPNNIRSCLMLHGDNAPFIRITRNTGKPLLQPFRRVIIQLSQLLIRSVLHHTYSACISAPYQTPVPRLWQTGSALLVGISILVCHHHPVKKNIELALDPYTAGIARDSDEPNFTLLLRPCGSRAFAGE